MFCAQFIEIYCIPLTEHACPALPSPRIACCCLSIAPRGVYLLPGNMYLCQTSHLCETGVCDFWVMCCCSTVPLSVSRIVHLTPLSSAATWWKLRKRSVNQKCAKGFAFIALRLPRCFLHAVACLLCLLLCSSLRCNRCLFLAWSVSLMSARRGTHTQLCSALRASPMGPQAIEARPQAISNSSRDFIWLPNWPVIMLAGPAPLPLLLPQPLPLP